MNCKVLSFFPDRKMRHLLMFLLMFGSSHPSLYDIQKFLLPHGNHTNQEDLPKSWFPFLQAPIYNYMQNTKWNSLMVGLVVSVNQIQMNLHKKYLNLMKCATKQVNLLSIFGTMCPTTESARTNFLVNMENIIFVQEWKLVVHKKLSINMTITQFECHMWHKCRINKLIMFLFPSNTSLVYCGKRHPWSVFSSAVNLTLHSSLSLKKPQFTVQYQVMDSNTITTVSDNSTELYEGFGPHTDYPFVSFSILSQMFSVHHITANKQFRIQLEVSQFRGVIFDGPGCRGTTLYQNSESLLERQSAHVLETTAWQATLVQIGEAEPFNATVWYMRFFFYHKMSHIYDMERMNVSFLRLSLHEHFVNHVLIKGTQFINVSIQSLHLEGINTPGCFFGGLSVFNNTEAHLLEEMFQSCHQIEKQFHSIPIVSSTNVLFVTKYSFKGYSKISCELLITETSCIGLHINLCDMKMENSELPPYYFLEIYHNLVNDIQLRTEYQIVIPLDATNYMSLCCFR